MSTLTPGRAAPRHAAPAVPGVPAAGTALPSLRAWAITRLAIFALTWPAMWLMQGGSKARLPWPSMWTHWDASIYIGIAAHGYGTTPHDVAFGPGYPLAIAAMHILVPGWLADGLLVSLFAGALAALGAGRLGGERAVWFMCASPAGIFLSAPYSESLFLAAGVWAWIAARERHWLAAGWLCAVASLTRADGLFLAAGLAAMALTQPERRLRSLGGLWPAALATAAWVACLHMLTGDWLAWSHAEKAGWDRSFTSPVRAWRTTWTAGFGHELTETYAWMFQLEIAAMVACAAVVAWMAWRRDWPAVAYCGLIAAAMGTSVWFESVPRALLVMWPAWVALARVADRRPWAGQVVLAVCVPLAVVTGLAYLSGGWAG